MIKKKLKVVIISLLFSCQNLTAQDSTSVSIPTDSTAEDSTVTDTVKYNLELHGNGTYNSGNVNRVLFNTGVKLKRSTSKSEYVFYPQYVYGTQDNELKEDEINMFLSFEVLKQMSFYLFGYTDISSSYKRSILYQHDIGGGLGKYLHKGDNSKASASMAVVSQITDFEEDSDVFVYRMSFRLKGTHQVFKVHKLSYLVWYKPSINIYGIYFLSGTLTYDVPITKRITFNTKFNTIYDNLVQEGVEPLDTQLLFGLKVKI